MFRLPLTNNYSKHVNRYQTFEYSSHKDPSEGLSINCYRNLQDLRSIHLFNLWR
jgi:hypothetical protein